MCTAISFTNGTHYFGRNLDLDYSYKETVTITPRKFPFLFRSGRTLNSHHAIIGMAFSERGYPLYYDATNEKGLSMAGLNFPEHAVYQRVKGEKCVASFEVIPWLLSNFESVDQVEAELKHLVITDEAFSSELPATPLHWIVADCRKTIVIEPTKDGVKVYDNPIGVLTNSPSFDYHLFHLVQYLNLTSHVAVNRFAKSLDLQPFCNGMGGIGLPGDLSSPSRFVRAAFTKWNSRCARTEDENISQFFHILGSVEQTRGCAQVQDDLYESTLYSSCCNTEKGIYYYRTYSNSQVSAVDIRRENLNSQSLITYPLNTRQQIAFQN